MFIVFEGLDGCGKSTLAKAMAQSLTATYLATPTAEFKQAREQLDDVYRNHQVARQLFYASTLVVASEQIREMLELGKSVVADRYWLSTQVYHGVTAGTDCLQLEELKAQLAAPDLTVFLDLDLETRRNRLASRLGNTQEDVATLTEDMHHELRNEYLKQKPCGLTGKWLVIDASQSTENQVCQVKEAIDELNQLEGK